MILSDSLKTVVNPQTVTTIQRYHSNGAILSINGIELVYKKGNDEPDSKRRDEDHDKIIQSARL